MSQRRVHYEELILIYRCEFCGQTTLYGFMTKPDETISREEDLIQILESTVCRGCRREMLKYYEKRLVFRVKDA